MAELFWQAKIWGLLHDSPLKPLQRSKSGEGPWNALKVMRSWQGSDWVKQADYIASASDRAAMGSLQGAWAYINYDDYGSGIQLRHLLSGDQSLDGQDFNFQLPENSVLHQWRNLEIGQEKENIKKLVIDSIPESIRESEDAQEVFWWLWRCLPEALSRHPEINDSRLFLIPAETRIPDCSIWSHNGITAALAGSLQGYRDESESRPYLLTFTFTPIQEVVKASRKMQDFWSGSWILHYLSARICWAWAEKYGPDSLVYPSLYAQPLFDQWLLTEKYPSWKNKDLVKLPSTRQLLTAGFPNVLVIVLPGSQVKSATTLAKQLLTGESQDILSPWLDLANQVKQEVFKDISISPSAWEEWLKSQWQIYWNALPLGESQQDLARPTVSNYGVWQDKQNNLSSESSKNIFTPAEGNFIKRKVDKIPRNIGDDRFINVNVGSWWAPIFKQLGSNLNAIKNARAWSLPTAFGPRSTISGIGSAVRREAKNDWVYCNEIGDSNSVDHFWQKIPELFDGREQLNATEVVKRGLKRVLPRLLSSSNSILTYPDLTVGIAGWLRHNPGQVEKYQKICADVLAKFSWADEAAIKPWGIPWVDEDELRRLTWQHPRLLNTGWLIEDYLPNSPESGQPITQKEQHKQTREEASRLGSCLNQYFPEGNPTDWYILACGDGDNMGKWLQGIHMGSYRRYIPSGFPKEEPSEDDKNALEAFLNQTKRMGPATHAALSRALLDFSNQLVPYLTEQRYAGRLIYSGGDDVLAYTNLWEWDAWLWDIRQCFKGDKDPHREFDDTGDYWRWRKEAKGDPPENVSSRPLFTMGRNASISFGVVIAHHSVPLAIALENLWEAEKSGAKEYSFSDGRTKDAVQVRVLYGNGNILKSTAKFATFNQWRLLLTSVQDLKPALFEQAAQVWEQHPAPLEDAIQHWVNAFCDRRDFFKTDDEGKGKQRFNQCLVKFLRQVWQTTLDTDDERDRQIQNWLKLAAFVLRKRDIQIGGV